MKSIFSSNCNFLHFRRFEDEGTLLGKVGYSNDQNPSKIKQCYLIRI